MKKKEKNKVGRPKLADKELKKKSYIMLGISAFLVLILLSGTLVSLNILPKFNKTKGSVPIYKTYEQGELFCLNGEEECFYTIEDNGDTVTALAEKNVDTNTNRQSDNANTLTFADTNYWRDNNHELKEKYSNGEGNYRAFVFDENSNLWEPLQRYKEYINSDLGKSTATFTLLSLEQVMDFGCPDYPGGPCNVDWIVATSYFLGTELRWIPEGYGVVNYTLDAKISLRPVITIAKSDFAEVIGYEQEEPENTEENNNTSDNKIYKLGDEFCLDTECFYTISDNGDTVTGLAKYSLLVGTIFEIDDWNNWNVIRNEQISPDTLGYGLQSSEVGHEETLWVGMVPFSNYKYWDNAELNSYIYNSNSNVWKYVQNYQTYLQEHLKRKSVRASLLSYEQAISLGCDGVNCRNAPSWLYENRAAYWLGSYAGGDDVWTLDYDVGFRMMYRNTYNIEGEGFEVRPIITITKKDILGISDEDNLDNTSSNNQKDVKVVTTTKKEDIKTTTTSKKVATTTNENKNEETKIEETTTIVGSINKVIKKDEVKDNNPIVPVGLGVVGISAIGSVLYFYLRKH